MIPIDRNSSIPMYEQIYEALKKAIENGEYESGSKLPSIRDMAHRLGLSKITVQGAYRQLASEGYIQAHHKSAYEVLPLTVDHFRGAVRSVPKQVSKGIPQYAYSFATGAMDPEGFDFSRWKRHIGYVLRSPERLMSYGDPQGEWELREELVNYLAQARSVDVTVDQLMITSGTRTSISLLGALLKRRGIHHIAIESSVHAMVGRIFEDYGYTITYVAQHDPHLLEVLQDPSIQAFYCTPSHGDVMSHVMPIEKRRQLLNWAHQREAYILEDDYDSELRYYGRPIPSLQGLDGGEQVIYLGTPSKVLPPSIRLSYIALPKGLMADISYQSASVIDQLTLASYIQSGEWNRQIRRLRKHYQDKSQYFVHLLEQYMGDRFQIIPPEGGVYVALRYQGEASVGTLEQLARTASCHVKTDGSYILLSFTGLAADKLEGAVKTLSEAWKGAI